MAVVSKRVVLATIGSLGDLHPMLALALELRQRGHHVIVATTEFYRSKVEELGVGFCSLRPNWDPTDRALIAQCEDIKTGPEVLFRRIILPHLRETYDDLLAVAKGVDLMIAGELVFAAPLVAEQLRLRWVSAILSPCSFFSAHDPSLLVNVPLLYRLRGAGWLVNRAILDIGRMASRHWWKPIRDLRGELRLSAKCDPLFRDKFSPDLVLALFSRYLAQRQPDWPTRTVQPGFLFHDSGPAKEGERLRLAAFLASGDAPIVFTLGSTAVHNPGNFYEASVAAAAQLGRRAVLLGVKKGADTGSLMGFSVGVSETLALAYMPYSQIFPHAAAIVHQGGSGTTGQALLAGRPQLVVPYGWDQPDNGARIQRLGVGLCLARDTYSSRSATTILEKLLADASLTARAAKLGELVGTEDSLRLACNAIESALAGP
jgi:rhamnosyltransferase subunit B